MRIEQFLKSSETIQKNYSTGFGEARPPDPFWVRHWEQLSSVVDLCVLGELIQKFWLYVFLI